MPTPNQQKLDKVVNSLEKVSAETKKMVFNMANSMTDMEVVQSFNQTALDLFNLLVQITTRMNKENEYKVGGYKLLFDNAVKLNKKMPIDQFTLVILEFAAEIYDEDENCFLKMTIPDAKLEVGNEFNLIRSEMFKKLWVTLVNKDKSDVKDKVILLTTFAHVYLYQTLLKNNKK